MAYQTAYLKRYYPVEFFAAMLNSVMDNSDKVAFYIETCKRMGIEVLPPDINESGVTFTVKGGSIRFGLAAIKNVGKPAMLSIIKARNEKGKFKSFTDFCQKVDIGDLNKRAVESLIKAGAFDSLGHYRSQYLAIYEQVMDGVAGDRKRNLEGQLSLFDVGGKVEDNVKDQVPDIKEFEKKHLLAMEKEMTGLYLSGHPLADYEKELKVRTTISTSQIYSGMPQEEDEANEQRMELDNKKVIMGGIITSVKVKATKNNSIMAFITLEDMYGSIEVLVFPKVYEKYTKLVQEDNLILIKGRLSLREDEEPKLLAEEIWPLKRPGDDGTGPNEEKLYIRVPHDRYNDIISSVKSVLSAFKGSTPVYICIEDRGNKKRNIMAASKNLWVEVNQELLDRLNQILGEDNIKVCS